MIDGKLKALSVIVGVCGENFCTLISDGRLTENYNGIALRTVSDNFQKIFKINDRVLFGMAGYFNRNENILDPFSEYPDKSVLSLRMALKAVLRYAEKLVAKTDSSAKALRNYLVGGIDNKRQFCLYEIHLDFINKKVDYKEYKPSCNQFGVCMALPGSLTNREQEFFDMAKKCVSGCTTHDEMIVSMSKVIEAIADLDMTVGKNIFHCTIN